MAQKKQPMPKMPEKKGWGKMWLGLLIGALVVGVAWLLCYYLTPPKEVEVEKVVEKEVVREVEVLAEEDEMASWNTYTNQEMGFRIMYPDDVSVSERRDKGVRFVEDSVTRENGDDGARLTAGLDFQISVASLIGQSPFANDLQCTQGGELEIGRSVSGDLVEDTTVLIDGVRAQKKVYQGDAFTPGEEHVDVIILLCDSNDRFWSIEFEDFAPATVSQALLEQMLDTFEFLN